MSNLNTQMLVAARSDWLTVEPDPPRAWLAEVNRRWPSQTHMQQMAKLIVSELVDPTTATVTFDKATARRVWLQVGLVPVGFHALLSMLTSARLLVCLLPPDGEHWGEYGLFVPSPPGPPSLPRLNNRQPPRSRPADNQ